MNAGTLVLVITFLSVPLFAASLHAKEQADMTSAKPHARTHATATITVQNSEAQPYDQTAGPALIELHLNETFTGDIAGESPVRALQIVRGDKSASLVSMQRFRGKLRGREGTFVLQGQEIVHHGKIKATWFVVPGSGTGDLSGLRGEGGFAPWFMHTGSHALCPGTAGV